MVVQTFQKVASVCGILYAASIQLTLEDAGIPTQVRIAKDSTCLEVQVPVSQAETAEKLLNPQFNFIPAFN